jgi:hypothetical protein
VLIRTKGTKITAKQIKELHKEKRRKRQGRDKEKRGKR